MGRLKQYLAVGLVVVLLLGSAPGAFAATHVTKGPATIGLLDDVLTSLGLKPKPKPKPIPNPKDPPTRTAVPEPATLAMLALGLAGVGILAGKRQSKPGARVTKKR